MSKKLKGIMGSSIALFLLTACTGGKLPPMDEEEANAIKENIAVVTDDDNKVYGNIRLLTEYEGASPTAASQRDYGGCGQHSVCLLFPAGTEWCLCAPGSDGCNTRC